MRNKKIPDQYQVVNKKVAIPEIVCKRDCTGDET